MVTHNCGGEIVNTDASLGGYVIDAKICQRCGEVQPDMLQSQLVLAHNKLARAGIVMTGRVTTVGKSSYAVRLPIELIRAYGIEPGEEVAVFPSMPGKIELTLYPEADRIRDELGGPEILEPRDLPLGSEFSVDLGLNAQLSTSRESSDSITKEVA